MLTQRQVKEVVKLLKSKDLNYRPAFQQVFESGGYMWATDGYVTFELFECNSSTIWKIYLMLCQICVILYMENLHQV